MSLKKINGYWHIDYYDGDGNRIRKKVSRRKREAEKMLRDLKREKFQLKRPLAKKKKSELFDNFAQTYLEYSKSNKSPSTHRRNKSLMDNLLGYFSGQMMDSIDSYMIEQYKLRRLKKVSKTSVNRELTCLRHMYNLGIKWGKLESNPVQQVRFFKEEPHKIGRAHV